MTEGATIEFDEVIRNVLPNLFGKSTCRQRVDRFSCLRIGIGEKVPHERKGKLVDDFYGEWEIGTLSFSSDWFITQEEIVLCARQDSTKMSLLELDGKLNQISFGRILSLEFVSHSCVCAYFDNNIRINFVEQPEQQSYEDEAFEEDPDEGDDFGKDEDDFFHVFCPNGVYVGCNSPRGWVICNY